jgi:Na+-driven multidrug efflux pump
MVIAGPAILTNLATPVGAIFVTRAMAGLGPQAVAGQATIERLSAVAFALVYALTGAIGPIFGQNMGAGNLPRVRQTLRESLLTVIVTVFAAWILLAVGQDAIVYAFSAKEETAQLVRLFCSWLAPAFVFTGCLFVANAAFNNLGFPLLSTLFNWGRATLGTIPFVAIGVRHGPTGVLYGQALGSVVFGLSAMSVAFWVTYRLGARPDGGKAAGGKSAAASPPGALVSRGEA